MALPPLELFSLRKELPCCRAALSASKAAANWPSNRLPFLQQEASFSAGAAVRAGENLSRSMALNCPRHAALPVHHFFLHRGPHVMQASSEDRCLESRSETPIQLITGISINNCHATADSWRSEQIT